MGRQAFRRWLTQGSTHEQYDAGAAECNVAHRGFAGGAVGDGLVDDTAAIQAAINAAAQAAVDDASVVTAGAVVRIPAAMTCRITKATGHFYSLTAASNVNILGSGPSSVLKLDAGASNGTTCDLLNIGTGVAGAVTNVYIDNLTLDGNGTNQTGTSRVILLNGCTNVWIGPNVKILNPKTRSIVAANSPKNITVGGVRGRLDASVVGVVMDGTIFTSAAVSGSSNQVTVTGATAAMDGQYFEVEQAGGVDGLGTGWRNLVGYAKYVSSVRLDMYSDSTLLTPLTASHSVTGARARVGTDNSSRSADLHALSQLLGGLPTVYGPGVSIQAANALHTGDRVEGAGDRVTFLEAKQGTNTFTAVSEGNLQIRGMTIDGYGPDGGAAGTTFKACIDLTDVTDVVIEDVTCRNASAGIGINGQNTDDVTLRRVRVENIFTSNGAAATVAGGVGIWPFNGPNGVRLVDVVVDGVDRAGVYYDAGTTSATGVGQHDYPDYMNLSNVTIKNTCRSGLGVAALALGGARWGVATGLVIERVGLLGGVGSTYAECDAIFMGGDQNGEYCQQLELVGVTLKDIGGVPLRIQGVRNTVRGVRVDDFNKAQAAGSAIPVVFESYGGYTATNVIAGPDPSYNVVEGIEVYYRGAAGFYTHAASFVGGSSVPDGASGTRTAQCLGNTVQGRFIIPGASKPATGMISTAGGATNCPTDGPNANVVGISAVLTAAADVVEQYQVQGEANSRYKRTAAGRQSLGGGAATFDVVAERITAGVYGLSTGQWQAPERTINYATDGAIAITPGAATLSKGSAAAMTLANPTNGTDDGTRLTISSRTAQAHVVTGAFWNNNATAWGTATFTASVATNMVLEAVAGTWHVISSKNVAFS